MPASFLSAQQIVARMQTALREKNTAHLVVGGHLSSHGKLSVTIHVVGDISLNPQVLVETSSASGKVGTLPGVSYHERILIVNGQVASRMDQSGWTCHSAQSLLAQYVDLTKILNSGLQDASNAGATAVAGVPVWHIRAQEAESFSRRTVLAPVDLYISQADFTLVREHLAVTLHSGKTSIHETVTAAVSRYGEPVNVVLPSVCTAPLVFSIQRVVLERPHTKADFALKRPSLTHVRRGTLVRVSVYILYRRVRAPSRLYERERVWHDGKIVFTSRNHDSVKPGDGGSQEWFYDTFTPWHPGHFRFTATAWSGRLYRHKTIWFWVT